MSAQILEVSLLGVKTVLRLERDAWSMVKLLRQVTNMCAPPPPLPPPRNSFCTVYRLFLSIFFLVFLFPSLSVAFIFVLAVLS